VLAEEQRYSVARRDDWIDEKNAYDLDIPKITSIRE